MPPLKKRKISDDESGKNTGCVRRWNRTWDEMFERLLQYKRENNNCLVPQRYKKDPKLGRWINKQREQAKTLSLERKKKLESIGFVWRVVHRAPWIFMFQRLVEYKKAFGNCRVPQRYKKDPRLGGWVREQRKQKQNLSGRRRQLLESIGFAWNAKRYDHESESRSISTIMTANTLVSLQAGKDTPPQSQELKPSSSPPLHSPSPRPMLRHVLEKKLLELRLQEEKEAATNLHLLKMIQRKCLTLGLPTSPSFLKELIMTSSQVLATSTAP